MAKHKEYEENEDEAIDIEDPYSGKGRKEMLDGDEISSEEEGFMEGYDEAEEESNKEGEASEEDEEELTE